MIRDMLQTNCYLARQRRNVKFIHRLNRLVEGACLSTLRGLNTFSVISVKI